MLRDHGTHAAARRAGAGDRLSPASGYPVVPRISDHDRARARAVLAGMAELGRDLPAGRRRAGAGHAVPQPAARRHLSAAARRGGSRRRRPRGADRGGAPRLVPGLRRRGDRPLLPHATRSWTAPAAATRGLLTGDDLAGWRATVEAPLPLRLSAATRSCKAGPWSQGPVALQQLALLAGFDLAGLERGRTRVRPHGRRVRQARVRRSRGLLRRSRVRRGADGRAAVRRATTPSAAGWSASAPRSSCGPGRIAGHGGAVGAARAGRRDDVAHAGAHGAGELDDAGRGVDEPALAGARRHLPPRRHRPPRQHGLGDAVRRLAAELAGDPGARLLPRHPRPDVLARGGPAGQPRARASGRAPRSRPSLALRDGEPYWPSARPAATSRTSGRCTCSCATSTSA